MKTKFRLQRLLAVVMILSIVWVAACGGEATDVVEEVDIMTEGAALLEDRCDECHDLERVTSASMTRAEWQETVEEMVELGAELNAEEQEILVAYLAEVHGP